MSFVFADTGYFVALLSRDDVHHDEAVSYSELVADDATVILVTTDAVITELLNFVARFGETARAAAVELARAVMNSGASRVEPQTRELLSEGIGLYAARRDKDWSVTDCMSLVVMDRMEISDALAADHAFVQAGKRALLLNET